MTLVTRTNKSTLVIKVMTATRDNHENDDNNDKWWWLHFVLFSSSAHIKLVHGAFISGKKVYKPYHSGDIHLLQKRTRSGLSLLLCFSCFLMTSPLTPPSSSIGNNGAQQLHVVNIFKKKKESILPLLCLWGQCSVMMSAVSWDFFWKTNCFSRLSARLLCSSTCTRQPSKNKISFLFYYLQILLLSGYKYSLEANNAIIFSPAQQ